MIGCLTETTTCVVAKPLVTINDSLLAFQITFFTLYSSCKVKRLSKINTSVIRDRSKKLHLPHSFNQEKQDRKVK